jgi:hypothetical protein
MTDASRQDAGEDARIVELANCAVVVPVGWLEITGDLPEGSPATLARPDGVGALQFSAGIYRGGVLPQITPADLRVFLGQLARTHGEIAPEMHDGVGRHPSVWCEIASPGERIRVWYVSNGRDVALVTYVAVAGEPRVDAELEDATRIVASLDFEGARARE